MTPLTGLTLMVHAIVVIARKMVGAFGFTFESDAGKPANQKLQTVLSIAIILLVFLYMSWLIFLFLRRAVDSKYANWKAVPRSYETIRETISSIRLPAPPTPKGNPYISTNY